MKSGFGKVKENIGLAFLGLLVLGLFLYTVFDIINSFHPSGRVFEDELKRGSYMNGTGAYATPSVLSVKHTANYIIPLGTEYYYIVFDEDFTDCVLVRAPKKWKYADTNLDSEVSFKISGKVRALDYDSTNTLKNTLREEGLSENLVGTYYVDTMAQKNSIMVAVLIIIMGLFGVILIQIIKGTIAVDESKKSKITAVLGVILFISAVLLLHYMTMLL